MTWRHEEEPAGGRRSGQSLAEDRTENLLDVTAQLRTAPCVPALREAVRAWRAGGYKGTTETTRRLLAYWFESDHRLANGQRFKYHGAQREALETLIFVWEYERVRARSTLLERYATDLKGAVPSFSDSFARYCVKMATGSGKTKVMSLAVAWQFFNAQREEADIAKDYARTFLIIAPNVIVLQRLATDFAGGRVFQPNGDPIVPRQRHARLLGLRLRDAWRRGESARRRNPVRYEHRPVIRARRSRR